MAKNTLINLTPLIRKILNFLFIILIIFDVVSDLHFFGKLDYGNIIWKIAAIFFINIIK